MEPVAGYWLEVSLLSLSDMFWAQSWERLLETVWRLGDMTVSRPHVFFTEVRIGFFNGPPKSKYWAYEFLGSGTRQRFVDLIVQSVDNDYTLALVFQHHG